MARFNINDEWVSIPSEGLTPEGEDPRTNMKIKLAQTFDQMLRDMGFDIYSPHLKDTPARMARMYVDEIFSGMYTSAPSFTVFPNTKENPGMVFLGNIDVFSTCSHHFKAFTGKAHIAYIPGESLVGISKLARITDWFARRPQVQEELTDQIADYIMEKLQPKGIGVTIEAVHNCIRVRGAKQSQSVMETTSLRGTFLSDKTVNDEFQRKIERLK